ncbi:MAG: Flp pilus assembly protein CpaB [Nitratireductor sp.]|nr:Flp pilus assembly protein CpaB [Nitratireductor sp.]MCC0019992.1 Flp pilus assembly protein CpaB [Nitratireductor sp.]
MSGKLTVMAGLAIVFGATSYYAGNQYLENRTRERLSEIGDNGPVVEVSQIVVANRALAFGDKLTREDLRLVDWPKDSLPEGSFSSIDEVVGKGERKAIQPIEANEPLLVVKLTGDNRRASLAGIISEGMRAVTIPVDTVKGVGGFVMPGDRVDIVFAQRDRKTGEQTANILLENVKVLSIDQVAGSRSEGPKVAQSVTLETDAEGAQRLALATNVGKLSLLLRGAGDTDTVNASAVSFGATGSGEVVEGEEESPAEDKGGLFGLFGGSQKGPRFTTVKVTSGMETRQASVPVEESLETEKQNQKVQ